MEDVLNRLEDELILLCIQVMEMLDRLKAAGIINEEEYQGHMREKRAFLDKRFHQGVSQKVFHNDLGKADFTEN